MIDIQVKAKMLSDLILQKRYIQHIHLLFQIKFVTRPARSDDGLRFRATNPIERKNEQFQKSEGIKITGFCVCVS